MEGGGGGRGATMCSCVRTVMEGGGGGGGEGVLPCALASGQ